MSWEVVCTAPIRLLMLCLLTCVAYLVMFNIDTIWTRVFHCDVCMVMSWFILVLKAVNVFCGGGSCEPTESISKKRQ